MKILNAQYSSVITIREGEQLVTLNYKKRPKTTEKNFF